MATDDRIKAMSRARSEATDALRAAHADEWDALLTDAYATHNVTVRRRRTGAVAVAARAAAEDAKRKERMAKLEAKLQELKDEEAMAVFSEA